MRNTYVKTAAVSVPLRVGDPDYNAERIIEGLEKAKDCGIVVFPELCVTGYTCADLFLQETLQEGALRALENIRQASVSRGSLLVLGAPIRYRNSLYDCAVLIWQGRYLGVVPKSHIPNYAEFYEARWFASGRGLTGLTIRLADQEVPFGTDILVCDPDSGAVVGTEICEDLWVAAKPSDEALAAGANIIVNPSASDETVTKEDYRRALVVQQSAAGYCTYVYSAAGTCESTTDLVFSGAALIAQDGHLLRETNFPEGISVTAALSDVAASMQERYRQNTFSGRGAEYRQIIVSGLGYSGRKELSVEAVAEMLRKEGAVPDPLPFVPAGQADREARCRQILRIQAYGLAQRMRATGIKTLVLGISGGLDSTLALIVAAEARKIVPCRIIAYTLPSEGNTSSETYENALELIRVFRAEERVVPIGCQVKAHLRAIGHPESYQGEQDTVYENAQARMRTYILMDAANMEGGLVVGTGDLSELALGWCTYNGDHMSMYGVNAGVPKTLVRHIVNSYAENAPDGRTAAVLRKVAATPISPELTPAVGGRIAQKTEEKIGPYDLNDFFLYHLVRCGRAPDKILALALGAYPGKGKEALRQDLERFLRRFFAMQFKRSCLPDGPKVGSVTLSPRGDWRMPSDASAASFLKILSDC